MYVAVASIATVIVVEIPGMAPPIMPTATPKHISPSPCRLSMEAAEERNSCKFKVTPPYVS